MVPSWIWTGHTAAQYCGMQLTHLLARDRAPHVDNLKHNLNLCELWFGILRQGLKSLIWRETFRMLFQCYSEQRSTDVGLQSKWLFSFPLGVAPQQDKMWFMHRSTSQFHFIELEMGVFIHFRKECMISKQQGTIGKPAGTAIWSFSWFLVNILSSQMKSGTVGPVLYFQD